jgi:ribosomal protein L11 methyltransferase
VVDVRRIRTVPPWDDRPEPEGELVVRINLGKGAGLTWGFGAHPTTSLMLSMLGGLFRPGGPRPRRVLDVGCGSGVLGIACARLGASEVLGLDVQAEAPQVAAANAALNGVAAACRWELTPVAQVAGAWDLVLANLPSSLLLRELAPHLSARARGGLLLVSGYPEKFRQATLDAFAALGHRPRGQASMADAQHTWCAALFG